MASAVLSRRVEKVVTYPPLSEMGDRQRREFHEAPLDADSFEDLPGKWQAAILKADANRPNLQSTAAKENEPRAQSRTASQAASFDGCAARGQ